MCARTRRDMRDGKDDLRSGGPTREPLDRTFSAPPAVEDRSRPRSRRRENDEHGRGEAATPQGAARVILQNDFIGSHSIISPAGPRRRLGPQTRISVDTDCEGTKRFGISAQVLKGSGGGRGIRTLDTVSRIHTFQACAFNHSATPPKRSGTSFDGTTRRIYQSDGPHKRRALSIRDHDGEARA